MLNNYSKSLAFMRGFFELKLVGREGFEPPNLKGTDFT